MNRTTKRVSHYILKEELGKGQYGVVYRGEDTLTHEIRAIKVIANSNLTRESQKEALKREIKIMKNLLHDGTYAGRSPATWVLDLTIEPTHVGY